MKPGYAGVAERLKELEAENARLRAALQEIRRIDTGPLNVQGHLGDIARRALEEKGEP